MSLMQHHDVEYRAHRYGVAVVVLLVILAIIMPLFFRLAQGAPITPDASSYEELLHAEAIAHTWSLQLIVSSTPYDVLLAIMVLFGVPWLLPAILCLVFVGLLALYLADHLKSRAVVLFSIATLVLSPTMSVLGTTHTPFLLAGCLLLAFLLFVERREWVATIFLFLLACTSLLYAIIAFIIVMFFFRTTRRILLYVFALAAAVAWLLLISSVALTQFGTQLMGVAHPQFNIFFELGVVGGISVFFFILAFYGLVMGVYGNRARMFFVFAAALALGVFFQSTMLLLTLLLSLLVGYAIMQLLMTDWKLGMLQESLLIIVGCIALFLLITTNRERVAQTPDADLAHALIMLQTAQHPGGVVTAAEYAPLVRYFARRDAVIISPAQNELLVSRDAKTTYATFERSHAAYVLITDDMQGTILPKSDSGILFLLEHSNRFVKLSQTRSSATWYFISLT